MDVDRLPGGGMLIDGRVYSAAEAKQVRDLLAPGYAELVECRNVLALFVEARDAKGAGFARYSMAELEQKARAALTTTTPKDQQRDGRQQG